MHNIHSKRLEPGPTPSQTPSSAIPTSGLVGRAIHKSAFEPKAAGAVRLTWPMYLPVVEVGGRIMRDGRDVMVPRPSTVCIAGVVEGRMGCGRLQPLLTQIFEW